MKTTTYLRWSLLIPFLVWGFCLLFFLGLSALPESITSSAVMNLIALPLMFYVFGIIGWFLPYLLLAVILLLWSFKGQPRTHLAAFALSPFAMTVLVMIVVSFLSLGNENPTFSASNLLQNAGIFLGTNILFALVSLVWGYICVGTGYGIYKILQRAGFIREELEMDSRSLNEPI
jgi:hypothetical protein